jgi:hypothetical protein
MKLFNPSNFAASLQQLQAKSISGANFINESDMTLKTQPFTATLAVKLINEAANINDMSVASWHKTQKELLDSNQATIALNMLCESTKYDGTAFAGFKNIAASLLEYDEAEIVRQIAVENILAKYSMLPDVKSLIYKAKNIIASKYAANAAIKTDVAKFAEHSIAIIAQIDATKFVVGIDASTVLIIDSAENSINQASYSVLMSLVNTELFMFDYNSFMSNVEHLNVLLNNAYDKALNAFIFKSFGETVMWNLADNSLLLNDKATTIASINQILTEKTKLSSNTLAFAEEISKLDMLLNAFNYLYSAKDSLVCLNNIVTINFANAKYYIACSTNSLSSKYPYSYIMFTKYANSAGLFKAVFNTFNDFAASMPSQTIEELKSIFASEIKVETDFMQAVELSRQTTLQNIDNLVKQKEALVSAKATAPESSLQEINSKILTIDDLIERHKVQLAESN